MIIYELNFRIFNKLKKKRSIYSQVTGQGLRWATGEWTTYEAAEGE